MAKITLQDLIDASDAWTDEFIIPEFTLKYGNQALGYINTEVGLILPNFDDVNKEYTALPEKWLRRLITPFLSWSIKMNDGSLTEAREYWEHFVTGLADFNEKAIGPNDDGSGGVVDPEYIDQTELGNKRAQIDFHATIGDHWGWW